MFDLLHGGSLVEKCVFVFARDLLKPGSASAWGMAWGCDFHKKRLMAFVGRKVSHHFFLVFLFVIVLFWLRMRYAASCMHMCRDICAFDTQDNLALVFFEPLLFFHPCKATGLW